MFHTLIALWLLANCVQSACNDKTLINLSEAIDGEIFTTDNTESALYTRLSSQWNAAFDDLVPRAIIMVESASDISITLKSLIIPCNLDFSVRSAPSGGHLWSGYSVLDDGVVIDLSRLNNIKFIHKNRLLVLEPGVTHFWANQFTKPFFKIFPTSGDCNSLAFGGFLPGGGLSLFLRSAGLSADYIEKVQVVLMNGDIVMANKNNEYKDLLYGIKGGGAGNFGIVSKYFLSTFQPATEVISFEVYWSLSSFKNKHELKTFLKTWAELQSGDLYREFTAWLVLLSDGFDGSHYKYVFRLLAIWNGDIDDGYKFWNDVFLTQCGCEEYIVANRGNIFTTNAWFAVEIHQSTFGGQTPFDGAIDARTVKDEWNDRILSNMARIMLSHLDDVDFTYVWLLVSYGGSMLSNDPHNEKTSFGHRDAVGDITLLITNSDGKETLETERLNELNECFLDTISPFYYPNHPLSIAPVANVPVAFYDCVNKPELYQKLVNIKKKYDPNNLLNNPVTIDVNQQCDRM